MYISHVITRLHSLFERNLTKFDLQFLDLFFILYIFYKFQSICALFGKRQEANKTLCIGNPEVYVNLEINFYNSFPVYISLLFFYLKPSTFYYSFYWVLDESDLQLTYNSRALGRNGRIVGVMSGAADDYLRYFLGVEDMCIPYNNKKVSGRVSICHPDDGRSRENQTSMLQTYSCRETRGNIM